MGDKLGHRSSSVPGSRDTKVTAYIEMDTVIPEETFIIEVSPISTHNTENIALLVHMYNTVIDTTRYTTKT